LFFENLTGDCAMDALDSIEPRANIRSFGDSRILAIANANSLHSRAAARLRLIVTRRAAR
jgi:hypothetical protein